MKFKKLSPGVYGATRKDGLEITIELTDWDDCPTPQDHKWRCIYAFDYKPTKTRSDYPKNPDGNPMGFDDLGDEASFSATLKELKEREQYYEDQL